MNETQILVTGDAGVVVKIQQMCKVIQIHIFFKGRFFLWGIGRALFLFFLLIFTVDPALIFFVAGLRVILDQVSSRSSGRCLG